MTIAEWYDTIPQFWRDLGLLALGGVIGPTLFAIFRLSGMQVSGSWRNVRERWTKFETALDSSELTAPFAFGVVQGFALRYFLVAVSLAYIGDILSFMIPAVSLVFWFLALCFVLVGVRLFLKIERRALEMLSEVDGRADHAN